MNKGILSFVVLLLGSGAACAVKAQAPYALGTSTITLMNGASHVIGAEITLPTNGNYNSVTVTPTLLNPELGLSTNNQGFKSLDVSVGNVEYLGGISEPLLNNVSNNPNDSLLLVNPIIDVNPIDNSNPAFGGLE